MKYNGCGENLTQKYQQLNYVELRSLHNCRIFHPIIHFHIEGEFWSAILDLYYFKVEQSKNFTGQKFFY